MGASIRVLVVAGEAPLGEVIFRWLQRAGHQVKFVSHVALLDEARRSRPDAIFINVGATFFDGLVLAKRLRRRRHLAAVPLVAFTENESPQVRGAALAAGFIACLVHPLTPETLAQVIEQLRDWIFIPRRVAQRSERLVERFNRAHRGGGSSPTEESLRTAASRDLSTAVSLPVALFESNEEPAHSVLPLLTSFDCAVARYDTPAGFVRGVRRSRPGLVVINGGLAPYIAYDLARRILAVPDPRERLVVRVSDAERTIQEPLAAEVGIESQLVRPPRADQLKDLVRLAEHRWLAAHPAVVAPH